MQIVRLRDLIVLSGAPHREGGAVTEKRDATAPENGPNGDDVVVTNQSRRISKARRAADTFVVSYSRKLRKDRLLWTPFGALYDPSVLEKLQALLAVMTKEAAEFNAYQSGGSGDCKIRNYLLWEPLRDTRKAAVEGWITRQIMDGDPEATAALPKLVAASRELPEQLPDVRV